MNQLELWHFLLQHGWIAVLVRDGYLFVPTSNSVH